MFFPVLLLAPKQAKPVPLVYVDVVEGKGRSVVSGDLVKVQVQVKTVDGKAVVDTKKRGMALNFVVSDPANKSWRSAVEGMKPGGTRKVQIDSVAEWGAEGNLPVVRPGSILIVTIQLVQAKPGEVTRSHDR